MKPKNHQGAGLFLLLITTQLVMGHRVLLLLLLIGNVCI